MSAVYRCGDRVVCAEDADDRGRVVDWQGATLRVRWDDGDEGFCDAADVRPEPPLS